MMMYGGDGGRRADEQTVEALVRAALEEDIGAGDRTTEATVPADAVGAARIVARRAGVLFGREPAERVFRRLEPAVELAWRAEDGEAIAAETVVADVRGPLRAILTGERTALNFLGRLSGIASLARRFVEAVEGTGARITDTRKTTPGWRRLEKAATAAGGAVNHRSGLYDMILLKENHLRAAGGIPAALRAVRRSAGEGVPVEIEVTDPDELDEVLRRPREERPDRILLDNMAVATLRESVRRVGEAGAPRPLLEASGGVTLASVREVAETGVDLVSVGALTHSAPALDLSLLVEA